MKIRSRLMTFLIAAAGMLAGEWLGGRLGFIPAAQAQIPGAPGVVSTRALEVVDAGGHRQILMTTTPDGSPGIWLMDKSGRARLNIALYGDDNATVVLNDENEQAVEILRTVGRESAPVLVMKSRGLDRLVMGVNWDGPKDEPFFVFYDDQGQKRTVFGRY